MEHVHPAPASPDTVIPGPVLLRTASPVRVDMSPVLETAAVNVPVPPGAKAPECVKDRASEGSEDF